MYVDYTRGYDMKITVRELAQRLNRLCEEGKCNSNVYIGIDDLDSFKYEHNCYIEDLDFYNDNLYLVLSTDSIVNYISNKLTGV